jgi:hypothetical protein
MGQLGLNDVAGAYDEAVTTGFQRNGTVMELLWAEAAHCHAASIHYRLPATKVPSDSPGPGICRSCGCCSRKLLVPFVEVASRRPALSRRLNRCTQVVWSPQRDGMSAQGPPLSKRQELPFSTRQSSTRGTPCGYWGDGLDHRPLRVRRF